MVGQFRDIDTSFMYLWGALFGIGSLDTVSVSLSHFARITSNVYSRNFLEYFCFHDLDSTSQPRDQSAIWWLDWDIFDSDYI
jgi:hypothetical protein